MGVAADSGGLNMEMITFLEELLTNKTTELEMTAEYGLELSQANEALKKEMEAMDGKNKDLTMAMSHMENEITSLRVQLVQAEEAGPGGQTPRQQQVEAEEEMQMRAKNAERNAAQVKGQVKELGQEIAELQEANKTLEESLVEARERESWLKGQVERLKDMCSQHEEEEDAWREEEAALRDQLDHAMNSAAEGGDSSGLKNELEASKVEKIELKNKISTLMDKINRLTRELDDLRDEGGKVNRRSSFRSVDSFPNDDGDALGDLDFEELDQNDFEVVPEPEQPAEEVKVSEVVETQDDASPPSPSPPPPEPENVKPAKEMICDANLERAREYVDEDEVDVFVEFINKRFAQDPDFKDSLPLAKDIGDIHKIAKDGILFCKLVNWARNGTIDERVINRNPTDEEVIENFQLFFDSCKSIGCELPKNFNLELLINATDCQSLMQMLFSLIKVGLSQKLNIQDTPELCRLGVGEETAEDVGAQTPEELLQRWVNFHLEENGSAKVMKRFDEDMADCDIPAVLLQALCESETSFLREYDLMDRAEKMLDGFKKQFPDEDIFLTPGGLLSRNPNLVYSFYATIFNRNHGLDELNEEEKEDLPTTADADGNREAVVFTQWINSLGIEPLITNISQDLKDGIILLKVFDVLNPGSVDWKQVAKKTPVPKFMRLQNANYVLKLCKVMQFSVLGVGGEDIEQGNLKMTLAVVWQMMRYHIQSILQGLSSNNKPITDKELVSWCNEMVEKSGNDSRIKSFKDSSLKDGIFFLHLINSIKEGCVKLNQIKHGDSVEDYDSNAQYAISAARKLGATIFVRSTDITKVRSKLLFTFVAALMATTKENELKKTTLAKPVAMNPTRKALRKTTTKATFGDRTEVSNVSDRNGDRTERRNLPQSTKSYLAPGVSPAAMKALEAKNKELEGEIVSLKTMNTRLCAEVGSLRAQAMGQFVAAARQKRQLERNAS